MIHIKLSMFEDALASKLYKVFDVDPITGTIMKSLSIRIEGLRPSPTHLVRALKPPVPQIWLADIIS